MAKRRIKSTDKMPRSYQPGDHTYERGSRLGAVRTRAVATEASAPQSAPTASAAPGGSQAVTGDGGGGGGVAPLLSASQYVLAKRDLNLPGSRVVADSDTVEWSTRDPRRLYANIKDGSVALEMLEEVAAPTVIVGRESSGAGPLELIGVDPQGVDFLKETTAANQRLYLGLGSAAVQAAGDFEASGTVAAHAALFNEHGHLKLFKILAAAANVTDGIAAQDWFPSGGDVTVAVNRAYLFEGTLRLSKGTGVATDVLVGFAGTATYTADWEQMGQGLAFDTAGNVQVSSGRTTTALLAVSPSNTSSNVWVTVRGVLRVTGAGTFIPQFQFTAAPGGVPQALAGTRFTLTEIGADTVTERGTWS